MLDIMAQVSYGKFLRGNCRIEADDTLIKTKLDKLKFA